MVGASDVQYTLVAGLRAWMDSRAADSTDGAFNQRKQSIRAGFEKDYSGFGEEVVG